MVTPASVLSSATHAQTTVYRKQALDQLVAKTRFPQMAQRDIIGKQQGKTVQWFRYSTFAENTVAATEGQVGSPLSMPSQVISATLSQYVDFISFSDVAVDTLIDDQALAGSKNLGIRAALTVNAVARNVVDAVQASTDQAPNSQFAVASDFHRAVMAMMSKDIEPFEGGMFKALISPLVAYDLKNDPAAGGFQSLISPTSSAEFKNMEDRGLVGTLFGCKIFADTTVKKTGSAPIKYRSYIFGNGGFGSSELQGRGPSQVTDPKRQRFNVHIVRNNNDQLFDPAGQIRLAVAYNFLYTAVILDTTNHRIRTIEHESSIG